jgi:hypothetical protein
MKERFDTYPLKSHERPTKIYDYFVSGRGSFPYDMLRYDGAWPATSTDAARMSISIADGDAYRKVRSVRLRSYREPTIDRWSSFVWSVGVEDLQDA